MAILGTVQDIARKGALKWGTRAIYANFFKVKRRMCAVYIVNMPLFLVLEERDYSD